MGRLGFASRFYSGDTSSLLLLRAEKLAKKIHQDRSRFDESIRKDVVAVVRRLLNAVESPDEVIMRHAFEVMHRSTASVSV